MKHDRPFFASGPSRTCIDTVWKHAVITAHVSGEGRAAGTIMWDMVKFYESISHETMVKAALKQGFDISLLKASLCMYRAPRYLAMREAVGEGLFPTRGLIAGCSRATTLMKSAAASRFGHGQRIVS